MKRPHTFTDSASKVELGFMTTQSGIWVRLKYYNSSRSCEDILKEVHENWICKKKKKKML